MHQISDHSAQLAVEHSIIAIRHGELVLSLGQDLQKRDNLTIREQGCYLVKCGQLIQHYAQKSLTYAQLLVEGENTTEIYCLAVQEHAKAAKIYSLAIATFTSSLVEELIKMRNIIY